MLTIKINAKLLNIQETTVQLKRNIKIKLKKNFLKPNNLH